MHFKDSQLLHGCTAASMVKMWREGDTVDLTPKLKFKKHSTKKKCKPCVQNAILFLKMYFFSLMCMAIFPACISV